MSAKFVAAEVACCCSCCGCIIDSGGGAVAKVVGGMVEGTGGVGLMADITSR